MVDIFVVRYNNKYVEDECIRLIKERTKSGTYNIIEYDNYPENIGLSTLWNNAIKQSSSEYICLINSDAYVTNNWLSEMLKAFKFKSNVGVVGPSCNMLYAIQGRVTEEQSLRVKDQFEEIPYISGFCMLLKTNIGIYFPEEIPFYHNEVSWQLLLKRAGLKRVWAKGAFVNHLDESTTKKTGQSELMRYNGIKQYEDWLRKFLKEEL